MSPATPGLVPRPATRPPRASRRIAGLLALAAAPVLVLGVLFVLPVAGMVAEGFVVDGRFAPGAVLDVLARPRVHRVAWFTVWTSGLATLLAVAVGLPAAYALHRLALPGRTAVRAALLVPFVLPTVVVAIVTIVVSLIPIVATRRVVTTATSRRGRTAAAGRCTITTTITTRIKPPRRPS